MHSQSQHSIQASSWLYLFISLHLIAWTVVPAMVRYNLPLDAIEGLLWGHQLEWGYDKNPYLNGWLSALARHFSPSSGWLLYLFSQLSVTACFWAVWRLASKMLSPINALLSVLLLEGIQYYHLHAIDFNDNTLELGLWALTAYFFYQALHHPRYRYWILTGLTAGLGMMAKYYTATLLLSMLLLLITQPTYRRQLNTLPPYLGLAVFLALVLPHVIWLFFHDFVTVTYVFARASNTPHWTNHFYFPLLFAWQQLEALLPTLALCLLLRGGKTPNTTASSLLQRDDQYFLLYVGLGPFLLTLMLSLTFGITLRAGWGMPLLSLWGIMLVAFIQPHLTPTKLYRFLAIIFILLITLVAGYAFSLLHSDTPSSANFPGREIAALINKKWRDQYHTKLAYVAGSRWLGGNLNFYATDHPAVFVEWNPQHAPWINTKTLQQQGAVFIWDIDANESLPQVVQQSFPQLKPIEVLEFTWHRNRNLPPMKIGIAMLPPATVRK